MKEMAQAVKFGDHDFRIRSFDAFNGAGVFLFATKKIIPLLKAMNIGVDNILDMKNDDLLYLAADMIGPVLDNISQDELKGFMSDCLKQVDMLMPAGYVPLYQGGVFAVEEIEYSTKTCFVLCFHAIKPLLTDFFGDVDWSSLLNPSKTTKR